jgi:hypothetical protein
MHVFGPNAMPACDERSCSFEQVQRTLRYHILDDARANERRRDVVCLVGHDVDSLRAPTFPQRLRESEIAARYVIDRVERGVGFEQVANGLISPLGGILPFCDVGDLYRRKIRTKIGAKADFSIFMTAERVVAENDAGRRVAIL